MAKDDQTSKQDRRRLRRLKAYFEVSRVILEREGESDKTSNAAEQFIASNPTCREHIGAACPADVNSKEVRVEGPLESLKVEASEVTAWRESAVGAVAAEAFHIAKDASTIISLDPDG
ncbi:hypothetical protein JNW90_12100 [Micromonospora sp. STR1s_5]|nr:hypothetical protein [Micromonospora sp. STR1s_5]